MKSQEILEKYIKFFEKKGHKVIPNVSLVPENDPTLLFVNSGMFPLVPYLYGEPHPLGTRLLNVQRCLRFEDLENVGTSNSHTVAFHMIGNWSLGDYFKEEQLPWAYEFLIEVLGLDPQRLYATVFEGDEYAEKDVASIELLKEIFTKYGIDAKEEERIFALGKKDNWWKRGDALGEPGGPTSEVFYYLGNDGGTGLGKHLKQHENEFLEIGNSVFMQFKKVESGWERLAQNNVDFGGGLERLALVAQGKNDIFQTDNFWPIIEKIQEVSQKNYEENKTNKKAMRVLADHMRACTFLAMDGVLPSNKDQGYVLRRLLRRMVRAGRTLGVEQDISVNLIPIVCETFSWLYPELPAKEAKIKNVFTEEENKFRKVLIKGAKEVEKELDKTEHTTQALSDLAFNLYQSLGYPAEMFLADLEEKGLDVNLAEIEAAFEKQLKEHQEQSRAGAEQKFKGGLADQSEQVVKYHTTTHLLHWALRKVLGEHVLQKGSNITGERLRFDFSHEEKLTDEEIKEVETLINVKISETHPVNFEMMSKEKAEKTGAIHAFGEKYGDEVKVYYIGESLESAISKEFCGGPHVSNTSELEPIKIYKQDKIGKGVLRVYVKNSLT